MGQKTARKSKRRSAMTANRKKGQAKTLRPRKKDPALIIFRDVQQLIRDQERAVYHPR